MKTSKHSNRIYRRLTLLGLATLVIVTLCVPSKISLAQDIEPDGICRTQSELPIFPDILNFIGSAPNMDGSDQVLFILNSNHALRSDSCDLDKYKIIYKDNICVTEQRAPGFFFIGPCDCHFPSVLGVKVKFSQNYNINGGVLDSRRSQAYAFIDANPYCFP